MTDQPEIIQILPAEHLGTADLTGSDLDIGGLRVPLGQWGDHVDHVHVYVRRSSGDMSVMEIHIARHDGLAQEEFDHQDEEAARYPLGPKEYWRGEMVGKWTYGEDGHLMTDEEFEADWED